MKDVILKLSNGEQVPLDKIYEFIKFVWKTDNPNKEYKEEVAVKTFNLGFGQNLLKMQFDKIFEEPNKYGFEITQLLDKDNNILKIYINDIK